MALGDRIRVRVYTQTQRRFLKKTALFHGCEVWMIASSNSTQKKRFEVWSVEATTLKSRLRKAVDAFKAFQNRDKI